MERDGEGEHERGRGRGKRREKKKGPSIDTYKQTNKHTNKYGSKRHEIKYRRERKCAKARSKPRILGWDGWKGVRE